MAREVRPLLSVLAEVPDVRGRHGRRHPLAAILGLAVAATLCGARSYSAIADWGRTAGADLAGALGFTRQTTPCAATFYLVFRRLDWTELEAALGRWTDAVLRAIPPDAGGVEGIALDGKTLRGSRTQGAPAVHLLSAVSHRLGLTLGQQAVDDKTNEIPLTPVLLRGLLLEGRVVTMDALLTQRQIAPTVLDGGGDYVMVAKENQPRLQQEIATVFDSPPPAAIRPGSRRRSGTPVTAAASSGA